MRTQPGFAPDYINLGRTEVSLCSVDTAIVSATNLICGAKKFLLLRRLNPIPPNILIVFLYFSLYQTINILQRKLLKSPVTAIDGKEYYLASSMTATHNFYTKQFQ